MRCVVASKTEQSVSHSQSPQSWLCYEAEGLKRCGRTGAGTRQLATASALFTQEPRAALPS